MILPKSPPPGQKMRHLRKSSPVVSGHARRRGKGSCLMAEYCISNQDRNLIHVGIARCDDDDVGLP